jgi:hypothetical protein
VIINLTIKWWKGIGDRAGMGLGIGGCNRWCPAATGHHLVALFFLPTLIKDRSLYGP